MVEALFLVVECRKSKREGGGAISILREKGRRRVEENDVLVAMDVHGWPRVASRVSSLIFGNIKCMDCEGKMEQNME